MQVIFESRDVEGDSIRDVSIARIRFALRRRTALVPRARVQFSDINGPRGGVDKRCKLELSTLGSGVLVTASLARDWRTALDLALGRATHALALSLDRTQKPSRSRASELALLG